jgi:hypothetical protein
MVVVIRVGQATKGDGRRGSTGSARGKGCDSEKKALRSVSSARRPQRLRSLITVHFGEMMTQQSGDVIIGASMKGSALSFTSVDILFHKESSGCLKFP